MEKPVDVYWKIRLEALKKRLEDNNFDVFVASDGLHAGRIVLDEIIPKVAPKTVSWGGSTTFTGSGLHEHLKSASGFEVLDTFDKNASKQEILERRRRALLCDLFITGTNALTESGQLVNLDMIGNRVGAITFGPVNVVILAGRNKVFPDLDTAMRHIKEYTAPINAMRLDKKTPCASTSRCRDCSSPDRICNSWTITEKSFPKGRIKIVLINESLGI